MNYAFMLVHTVSRHGIAYPKLVNITSVRFSVSPGTYGLLDTAKLWWHCLSIRRIGKLI